MLELSLTNLANLHGTDKGTLVGNKHAYSCIYDIIFRGWRNQPVNLMEIGLNIGGPELGYQPDRQVTGAPSLSMWLDYFPSGKIHGVDISDFSMYQNDRFDFYRADCGNVDDLKKVAQDAPACDFIIDDGSHASYHQQLTLLSLFPALKEGGFYIIEDLHWQPDDYECTLPSVPLTKKLLTTLVETGDIGDTGSIGRKEWETVLSQIENIFLVDHRTLVHLGRFSNKGEGLDDDYPKTYDRVKLLSVGHLKAIIKKAGEFLISLAGNTRPLRRPLVKLAVIQKKVGAG